MSSGLIEMQTKTYLNENDPHRLICVITWSLVSGSVWQGLGGVTLLEVVSLGKNFEVSEDSRFLVLFLCLMIMDQDGS